MSPIVSYHLRWTEQIIFRQPLSLWRLVMETTARHRTEWCACGLRFRLGTQCCQQRNLHVVPNLIEQIGRVCNEPPERMHLGTVLIAIEAARPDDVAELIGLESRRFECGEPFVRGIRHAL